MKSNFSSRYLCLFVLIIVWGINPKAFGQIAGNFNSNPNSSFLKLSGRTMDLQKSLTELKNSLPLNNLDSVGDLFVIRFTQAQTSPFSKGIKRMAYLGNDLYLVRINKGIGNQELTNSQITQWGRLLPTDKISPQLRFIKTASQPSNEPIIVFVKRFDGVSSTKINQLATSLNGVVLPDKSWEQAGLTAIQIDPTKIDRLAQAPEVYYIQQWHEPKSLNTMAEGLTNVAMAQRPLSLGGYNLLGEGVTLGIGDNGNVNHLDYIDRLKAFNPENFQTHASHTTGTMAGNGLIDPRYRGFAPHAQIISDLYNGILVNEGSYYETFGMTATNNSYAAIVNDTSYAGLYDVNSAALDNLAFSSPKVLNVFAAGNDGQMIRPPYENYFGNVVGAYSTAKNVLVVGNMGLNEELNFTSSRGPVRDGRLKPEITAMGTNLRSTYINNQYSVGSGTSMACPNVTGAIGLAIERYHQIFNGTDPENALMKILFMNGADDLGKPGPDFKFGFGVMNLNHTLKMLDNHQWSTETITTGQEKTATITIPAGLSYAKIMLYWNDPAGSPLSIPNLVNDLDLSIIAPDNTTHLPLVLNTTPSLVSSPAVEGEDHINNVEQVVLDHPMAGNYTIKVKGHNVPEGPQTYYLAYSYITPEISFHYPYGGETFVAGDSVYVYWEAAEDNGTFSLSYSIDNGQTWQLINNNIAQDKRFYLWDMPSTINSAQCLLKITRGTETVQNQNFVITKRPKAVLASITAQCPGSIVFSWASNPAATQYKIYRKIGPEMSIIDSTTDTTYVISGLDPTITYWVAVAPVVDNQIGIRSVAISRLPSTGSCNGIIPPGDLRMAQIKSPVAGRQFTTTAFTNNTPFIVNIQNFGNQTITNYTVSWQFNGGAWQSQPISNKSINPGGARDITLPSLSITDTGHFELKVAVTNTDMTDPVSSNDTLTTIVRSIANPILDIGQTAYEDGFEQFPQDLTLIGQTKMGIGNSDHWDFSADKANGRMRSFITHNITIEGTRSISLDNQINQAGSIANSSQNYLTGTFNLSNDVAGTDEVRVTFDYLLAGDPKFPDNNKVWVRGNDADAWIPFYTYEYDETQPGAIYTSGSISISDILLQNNQQFSASTQIRFGQKDTSLIESATLGNGLTLDNFTLSRVTDDLQLIAIDSIPPYNCNLSAQVPLTVKVYNSVSNSIYNIPIFYQLDGQSIISDVIDSISGKDTLDFTFSNTLDLSALDAHQLSVWMALPSDTYRENDSLLNYVFYNQPVIEDFPYLEDFENGDGHFYTGGISSSWQYGHPASSGVDHAASGQMAWKTNLTGPYNDMEFSYLYSPCYDISGLTNPTLSFNLITDLETNPNPNDVWDQAYVEYTTDGKNWERLLGGDNGYNWYNNPNAAAWTKQGETWWHVATASLPQTNGVISFRFVLHSDPAAHYEGVAIDDIHIYDLENPIYSGDSLVAPIVHSISQNQTQSYIEDGQILGTLTNTGQALSQVGMSAFRHTIFYNPDSSQYFLPENFVVQTEEAITDSALVHLYVLDNDINLVRNATTCLSCPAVKEIFDMGVSYYSDPDPTKENSSLTDNQNGTWDYIPSKYVRYIPYANGYTAQFKVGHFSEIWFNSGGPNSNDPLNIQLFDFSVQHYGTQGAQLNWKSATDENTIDYTIQRADDSNLQFQTIGKVRSEKVNAKTYGFIDTPNLIHPYVLYRILYRNINGETYSSKIRRIDWKASEGQVWVYPNPVSKNENLKIRWFKGDDLDLAWEIYDYTGRLLKTGQFTGNPYNDNVTLPISSLGLPAGNYLLKVKTSKQAWTFKIVFVR